MLAAEIFVLWFEQRRVDSGRNHLHPTTGFDYWASADDFGKPVAVCDHARSAFRICPHLPRMCSLCQQSVCRPSQDRAWIARLCLVGVPIASAIEKAASGHVPHIVDADNDAHSSRQRRQPTGNVEPIGHRVKMHHIHSCQILGRRR